MGVVRGDRERPLGHDGDHRHVLPGRPDRQRLGRLGALHGFAVACFRERARRPGPLGLLGPYGLHQGWRPEQVPPPPLDGDQAWAHLYVGGHGLHHAGDHGQDPLPLVLLRKVDVHGHPERLGGHLQGSCCRLGSDCRLLPLLRGRLLRPRLAEEAVGDARGLRLQAAVPYDEGPRAQEEKVGIGAREWPLGDDGDHRHVLPGRSDGLGVRGPVGFWDPVGYTTDGSVENFNRRRQTELKHGRISMLATMGYITPELTGKFPGYLSPSMGLKFADIPNGLAALSKVPAIGWAQIIGYMALCEISADQSAGSPGAQGDFGWKLLTSSDPAKKTRKLSAEIANGRLAMMAIIGMFFQDGLTGSAWGDWSLYTDSPLRAARC